jgi:hypothetical protein
MIKYIVETTSSYSDLNGNTYHFARITSTKTNRSLVIDSIGGSSNAAGLLFRLKVANDWSEVYDVQKWEKKREWQRLAKFAKNATYEGNVTAKMIRALNRKVK